MTPEQVLSILSRQFPDDITSFDAAAPHPMAVVKPARWHDIALFLRDDERLGFDWLRCITGVDHIEDKVLTAVYELHATRPPDDSPKREPGCSQTETGYSKLETGYSKHEKGYSKHETRNSPLWRLHAEIAIRVDVDRDHPHLPSVADVWPAADWHEREAFDLLGLVFDGHPDLRRILCCEDWVGHPLRKDYEFPLEYHGIPAVTEYGQSRTQH